MKRFFTLLLAALLLLSLASCGRRTDGITPGEGNPTADQGHNNIDNNHDNTNEQSAMTHQNSHELLAALWTARAEDDRFPIMGGDYDNVIENAPGAFDLTHAEAAANIDSLLSFPSEEIGKIDNAASIIHSMNANIFTCGAYHVTSAEDTTALAERVKNHVLTKQFLCGSPERLIILHLPDNYLMVLYGTSDAVAGFADHTKALIADTTTLVDQTLTS